MTVTRFAVQGATRTDIIRRTIYKGRNLATLARMHQRHANARSQPQSTHPHNPTNFPPENVLDNPTSMSRMGMDLDEDTDDESDLDMPETPLWIDLVEEQPDEIDQLIAADREKHRQRARHYNWDKLLKALTAEYMKLRLETDNWASRNCYDNFISCATTCKKKKKKPRLVDLVDIRGQRRQLVEFCKCTPDGVRLLQMASGATAISALSHSPWPSTIGLSLDHVVCVLANANMPETSANLFQQLSTCIVNSKRQEIVNVVIQLTPQEVLAFQSCPACFGPKPPNSADYPETTRARLVVCLDANFQQRHQMKAGPKSEVLRTPRIFLSQSLLDSVSEHIREQEAQGMAPQQADRCTEAHKAADDKRNESTWKGCDDTGIMGCCCRHDAGIYFANIFKSGEQRLYPMAIIQTLLSVIEPKRQVGILYDIGCTMGKYIDRRQLIPKYRSQITFGTSVFHAYAHNWLCQLEFHPRFNKGWGLSDGEGLERMWSYLSPLVSPLRYATRNHRLAAISHRLKHHNEKGIKQLPSWLRKKFTKALKRRGQTQAILSNLLSQRNPHRSGRNYSVRFFNKQWSKQRTFHADDTQNEHDRRQRLVEFYVREATLEHMRTRLRSPEIFLATVEEVDQLMNSIVAESARLSDQLVELTGAGLLGTGIGTDEEEEKLRLLLWDAKSKLFVEAVHLQAEREPLNNSHIMGSHLGTKGKENIIKALQNRRPAVKKIIDSFNRLYSTFQEKFPNRRLSDSHHHPLTYDVFKEWPMDHAFWTDGLYYHSDAPWSTDPNVREGINCILILGRIQEEFELLAQELARAMGWAVATYTRFTETVDYITSRITLINTDPTTVADDLDELGLGAMPRLQKLQLIKQELTRSTSEHADLLVEWSDNITWLWKRCQPTGNNNHFQQWLAIVEQANLLHLTRNRSHADDVDDWIEEAVLDEGLDDGDDAEENLIYQFEALRPPGQVANNDHAESRPAPALED
ncbi:hypothetical protein MJO28_014408 [Puccinia striiformis f. sp. tritici]|uniref:Uncharacterized protein n=1 Tax=Puccinia striiformis f. sp. tritici TaxID=168172 RepID=A0ACC0DVF9_9BASI|nr:hypothetical protein MJO28_014408 [Puccinia striiformis f. sp. tritici]